MLNPQDYFAMNEVLLGPPEEKGNDKAEGGKGKAISNKHHEKMRILFHSPEAAEDSDERKNQRRDRTRYYLNLILVTETTTSSPLLSLLLLLERENAMRKNTKKMNKHQTYIKTSLQHEKQ